MGIFDSLFGPGKNVKEALEKGATIIDVRTPGEFAAGHAKGALNIPLDTISTKLEKIKSMKKPLVMCCASGARSGQATSILKNNGVEDVYNGGSWVNLN